MSEDQGTNKQRKPSALKAYKQSLKANKRNSIVKSMIRTYSKNFLKAVASKDLKASIAAFAKVQSVLFKAVKKNVIKFNKAVRTTSKLNKKLKALEASTK